MNRKSILFVDDEPRAIKALKAFLGAENYKILEALDGKEALRIASERCPDLILLDLVMPGMNGFGVCKALKRDRKTKDIPVIFMTTYTDEETIKGIFLSGGSDYVRRPVNKIELLARIRSALDQQELMKKALEEKRLKGVLEMARAICHELNQPMTSVAGYSELLLLDIPEDNALHGNIKAIIGQVERMAEITRKLMKVTKYEAKACIGEEDRIIDIDKASRCTAEGFGKAAGKDKDRGRKNILVVDDERLICDMLTQAFRRFGYRVRTAGSAEEALDILQDERFQVMFLDLDLPGMNGVDLCKRIRKDLPIAVIYAMTGHDPILELGDCREAGFDGWFKKPASLKKLHDAAENAFMRLEKRSSQ